MSIVDLLKMPDRELMVLLAMRQDLLRRVWVYRRRFTRVFALAHGSTSAPDGTNGRAAADFVAHTVALLRRPEDLLSLCDDLPEAERIPLIDALIMHPGIEPELVASLVSDKETFDMMPGPGSWVGHAVWRRGLGLMQDSPGRRFDIEELLPLGVVDGSARSLMGAALDRGNLSEHAITELLKLFPTDRYLTDKISKMRS